MIRCVICEKKIRGNAAREVWEEEKQENRYFCKACDRWLAKAEAAADAMHAHLERN